MAEDEALALATINPAKQLQIDHRVGSLTPGKDADFVIWDGHPLSMHSRAEQTWIDGTLYFSRERDAELRRAAREERAALITKVLAAQDEDDESGSAGEEESAGDAGDEPERGVGHRYDCDDREDYWHARTHS
jgi:adenine deaminase